MSQKRTIYDAHIQIVYEPGKEPVAIVEVAQIGPNHVLSPAMIDEAARRLRVKLDHYTRPVPKWPFEGGGPSGGAMPVPKKAAVA